MPRRSRLLLLAAAMLPALLSACTIWREPAVHTWRTATGGHHYEQLIWQEIKAGNWAQVERRLGATFVSVAPDGRRDRAAFMQELRRLQLEDFQLADLEVRPAGGDMIVTYTARLRGAFAGRPLPAHPLRMMTVWQQVGRAWIVVAHSVVPVQADPPPPASR
jgi:hypothetical protein